MFDAVTATETLDAKGCADALHEAVLEIRRIGARRLALAAHWADLHHPDRFLAEERARRAAGEPSDPSSGARAVRTRRRDRIELGAEGTPLVAEYAPVELGVLLQVSTLSASSLLRDALELRHRLPAVWAATMRGEIDDWKARKVARATRVLTAEQAAWVDGEVVAALVGLPFGRAMDVVEGKVIAADPAGHETRRAEESERRYVALGKRTTAGVRTLFARGSAGDLARLMAMVQLLADRLAAAGDTDAADERRAKALALLGNPALACVVLARTEPADSADPHPPAPVVAAATEVGRLLEAQGPAVVDRLRARSVLHVHLGPSGVGRVEGLGAVTLEQLRSWLGHDRVTVRPVAYPREQSSVDDYQIPRPMEEAVILRHPFEVFPYGTLRSRRADLDHTTAFVPRARGGTPGQTSPDNLGPLGRTHHRAKTFGGFTVHQPVPGVFSWRLPTGRWYRVDHTGTQVLDHTTPPVVAQLGGAEEAALTPVEVRFRRLLLDHAA